MNHSRTSGDSRRRGKRLQKFYSYCNQYGRFVNSRLDRRLKVRRARSEEAVATLPSAELDAIAETEKLSVVGPTTIECFGRKPRGPIVRFELSAPNGETISFPIRCGLYAAGGDHE